MAVASVLGTKAGHVPSAMFLKENHESFKNRYQNAYGQHCTYKVGMILEKKRAKFSIFLVVSPLSCLQRQDRLAKPSAAQAVCNELAAYVALCSEETEVRCWS